MPSRLAASLAIAALTVPLFACSGTNGAGQDGPERESHMGEQIGTVVGAIGGAILGSRVGRGNVRTLSAIAGGIAGAWAGGRLGRMLDERDRTMQDTAAAEAMNAPVGKPVAWSNPESGNAGSVTTLKETTRPADGATCRSFEQSVTTKDGRVATERGTACRNADGSWRVSG